jgi:hypothetical protein
MREKGQEGHRDSQECIRKEERKGGEPKFCL